MKKFTEYVTEDITEKLLEKDAPLELHLSSYIEPNVPYFPTDGGLFEVPTIEQVCCWFWDKHKIWIEIQKYPSDYKFFYSVETEDDLVSSDDKCLYYDDPITTYIEAINKAIELI